MCLLIIYELLGLIVKRLTTNDEYSLCNSENLSQLIQMQLSKKQNTFSRFVASFLKSTSNFTYFGKKVTLRAYVFSKLDIAKHVVRQMSRKPRFRTHFDGQHVKWSETHC